MNPTRSDVYNTIKNKVEEKYFVHTGMRLSLSKKEIIETVNHLCQEGNWFLYTKKMFIDTAVNHIAQEYISFFQMNKLHSKWFIKNKHKRLMHLPYYASDTTRVFSLNPIFDPKKRQYSEFLKFF